MDPFVRRLVERLNDPARPLSRNRHFHTFDNPDGQQALRIARRLHALRQDIEKCLREGGRPIARPTPPGTSSANDAAPSPLMGSRLFPPRSFT